MKMYLTETYKNSTANEEEGNLALIYKYYCTKYNLYKPTASKTT